MQAGLSATKSQGRLLRNPGAALIALCALLATAFPAEAVPPTCTTSPNLLSVTPNSGPISGGTGVTLGGTGFCSTNLKVWFGGLRATSVSFGSSTSVTATTPAGAALGPVIVRVQQRTSEKVKQSSLVGGFTYTCAGCTASPIKLQFEGVDPAQQTIEPNGVLDPGETSVAVAPTLRNTSGITATITGAITSFTGPQNGASDITYTVNDSAASYGSVANNTNSSCTSTGNCYDVKVTIGGSGARATTATPDWDATMEETPTVGGSATTPIQWRVHVGNTFTDVPTSYMFYTFIERLVHNHVTFGTFPGIFSPEISVPRGNMAAFIARSFAGGDSFVPTSGTITASDNPVVNGSYDCQSGGTSVFADVAPTDQFCRHIHLLAKLFVTVGCDSVPDFCQTPDVTRGIMSVFISRALVPSLGDPGVPDAYTDPNTLRSYDCTNGPSPFSDVPLGGICKNIGYIWALGIVDGYGNGTFGPNVPVTRGQTSKFIGNAFNLTIGPP